MRRHRLRRSLVATCGLTLAASTALLSGALPAQAATTVEAESGTYGGRCGDNQAQIAHSYYGTTTVFNGGSGCTITFTTSVPIQVDSVRWAGGGVSGQICGRFSVKAGTAIVATSSTSCSTAGGTAPGWQDASGFPAHRIAAGTYQLIWSPNVYYHDAEVDYITVSEVPPTQCSDGVDNDGDGYTDFGGDPGCTSTADDTESPNPPACGDGIDNDGDLRKDYPADPGCDSTTDTTENPDPQCGDKVDNDGDGKVDYPADPGCASARDDAEGPTCAPTAPGVVACLEPTTEITRANALLPDVVPGPDTTVLGYVDEYQFVLANTVTVTLPCVTLKVNATNANGCAAAGGVFQTRRLTLVEETVNQPTPVLDPFTSVGICHGELTLLALNFGVNSAPAVTTC